MRLCRPSRASRICIRLRLAVGSTFAADSSVTTIEAQAFKDVVVAGHLAVDSAALLTLVERDAFHGAQVGLHATIAARALATVVFNNVAVG